MKKLKKIAYYIILLLVVYLIYVYPFEVLNSLLFSEPIFKVSSLFFSFFCFFIVMLYFKSNSNFFLLKFFVYEGMGIGFISFWVVSIGLILNIFLFEFNFYIGVYCLVFISLFSLLSLFKARLIKIKYLEIFSDKVSDEIKLIFLSDTHLGSNSKKYLEKIYNKIKDFNFDFLLIGGDFIDSSSFDLNNLEILKNIKKPILFVSGNHEYYINDNFSKLKKLKDFGINFLDNKTFKYKNINFIGVSDNQRLEYQEKIVNKLVNKKEYNLVLVHKPSLWSRVNDKVDLMLSGHTHNGQIFPFNFFVRLQFKNIYGLYKKYYSKLYVSSGSGCWGPKMRLGTSNEIINIKINNVSNTVSSRNI